MQYEAKSIQEYLEMIPEDRQEHVGHLVSVVRSNLPEGFEEGITYKMIAFYVPHSIYSDGYHCDPKMPLPFINIASQKNFIALYHMGLYADKALHDWFVEEYPKHSKYKLNMGKSCIRFKQLDHIPYDLIAELCQKMTVKDWITLYEDAVKR